MSSIIDKQQSLHPMAKEKLSLANPDACQDITIWEVFGVGCQNISPDWMLCESVYSLPRTLTICGSGGNTNPTLPGGTPTPWGNPGGTTYVQRDIHNKTTDPCISKTVETVLDTNAKIIGVIEDIIKKLDKNVAVDIKIYDAQTNSNNRPGQTSNSYWDKDFNTGNTLSFRTDITLSKDHLTSSSKEYLSLTLIHEILHAYFRENTEKSEAFEGEDHSKIAKDYVTPVADFLSLVYGITKVDAYAMAWDSVSDTDAYKNSSLLKVGVDSQGKDITMLKSELSPIATQYLINAKGKSLCD